VSGFIDRLYELSEKANAGDVHINSEIFKWLIAWFPDRILVTDKQMVAMLVKN